MNSNEYWKEVAEGVLQVRAGAVSVIAVENVVKTGRRVKLTGTLKAKEYPDAELFFMTLERQTELGWVPRDVCIKLHGGKNAMI